MVLLLSTEQAQKSLAEAVRRRRIAAGLTQAGLAARAGVALPSLRRFEQQAKISLEALVKLLMALDALDELVDAVSIDEHPKFDSLDNVLADKPGQVRKRGWRN